MTYIIDQYDELADVTIFTHAHQYAWHNEDVLGQDVVLMLSRLSASHVLKQGYVNLRCAWQPPGCTSALHPKSPTTSADRPEEMVWAQAWQEIFPDRPVPDEVAQPAGAQFAVSRLTIQKRALDEYSRYRRWLLTTSLPSSLSGRVWEYLWHILFFEQVSFCPSVDLCLCQTYEICQS